MSTTETHCLCGLKREDFQTTVNGKNTDLYILKNSQGYEVAITNYGGAVVAIMVPDKDGNVANVIQGHDNIQDVINSPEPYLSTLIGRYGNRIKEGKFTLNGKEYLLAINNGPNALHGGPAGFHAQVWDALQISENTLVLNYVSPYLEEGFTGEMKVTVAYTFSNDNELIIGYMATTNKKTIVNLTHHAFFSLQGIANPTPCINDQVCEINADFYIPIDENSIPTGEILKVADTPFDFRTPKAVGKDIDADNEQIKNGAGALQPVSPSLSAAARSRCTPPNRACKYTATTGPTATRASTEPHSPAAAPSASSASTSPTLPTVRTSPQSS